MLRQHHPIIRSLSLPDAVDIVILATFKSFTLAAALLAVALFESASGPPTLYDYFDAAQSTGFLALIGGGTVFIALLQMLFTQEWHKPQKAPEDLPPPKRLRREAPEI